MHLGLVNITWKIALRSIRKIPLFVYLILATHIFINFQVCYEIRLVYNYGNCEHCIDSMRGESFKSRNQIKRQTSVLYISRHLKTIQ